MVAITTATDNNNDIDDTIMDMKRKISFIKKLRQQGRESFSKDQESLCIRQHYCAHHLNRLLSSKKYHKSHYNNSISSGPSIMLLNKFRSLNKPNFVKEMEKNLCQALHQDEIKVKQLSMMIDYHNDLAQKSETTLKEEIRISEKNEEELLRRIKFASIDMAGCIVKYDSILKQQKLVISRFIEDNETTTTTKTTTKKEKENGGRIYNNKLFDKKKRIPTTSSMRFLHHHFKNKKPSNQVAMAA